MLSLHALKKEIMLTEKLLKTIQPSSINVIDSSIKKSDYIPIDLSKNNNDLLQFDVSSSSAWEKYINDYLKSNQKELAYGGYLETRNLYDRSSYFNTVSKENQRNIHIGLDLWCPANTNVLAAFNGVVHSFNNNTNFGDYGPTIILKHQIDDFSFYTLYGHLSINSLEKLAKGKEVKQGEVIAQLGTAEVNGDYAPHLHFQIIIDIEEKEGDYPGVCSLKDLDFYTKNTIDPKLVLGLD